MNCKRGSGIFCDTTRKHQTAKGQLPPTTEGLLSHPLNLSDERHLGFLEFIKYNKRMSIVIPVLSILFLIFVHYMYMYFLPALHTFLFDAEKYEKLKSIQSSTEFSLIERILFPLPGFYAFFIEITVITVGLYIYYMILTFKDLRKGLRRLYGYQLTKETGGEVYRIIENTARTLGIPVPRIHILNISARNAITLGFSPQNSHFLITRGLLESLNRPEFEAVVAHAFANIRLHNTSFLTLMQTYFGGLLDEVVKKFQVTETQAHILTAMLMAMTIIGFIAMPHLLWMGVPLILGYAILAPLAWLRQKIVAHRTQLADALALEVTKDPHAYISALKKVAGHDGLTIRNASLLDTLKFSGRSDGLLATHPPLTERIAAILRTWRLRSAIPLPEGMPELNKNGNRYSSPSSRLEKTFELDLGIRTIIEMQGLEDREPMSPYLAALVLLGAMIIPLLFLI